MYNQEIYIQVATFNNKQVVISKEHEILYLRLNNVAKIRKHIEIMISYEINNVYYINALSMIKKYLELVTYDDMLESITDDMTDDDIYNSIHETYINNLLDIAYVLNVHEILKALDVLLEVKVIYYDLVSI